MAVQEQATKEQLRRIRRFRLTNMCYGCATATVNFNVLLLQTTGLSPAYVGLVMSMNSALGAIAPPIWGLLADKIRSQYKVYLISAVTAGIVAGLMPLSTGIRVFGIVLTSVLIPLFGFFRMPGFSMLDAMSVSACKQTPGVEFSSVRVWRSIGMSVVSMIYSPLTQWLGVEFVYYAFAFFVLVVFLTRDNLKQFETVKETKKSVPFKELKVSRIFTTYYLAIFLVINLLMQVPTNCNQFMTYLIKEVGGNTSMVGFVNGLRTGTNVLIMFAAPLLKRRFSMPTMMMGAAGCFMAEMLLYQVCSNTVMVTMVCMLGGMGLGLTIATGVNYVSLMAPKGLEATCISLYAIGNPLMGIISNALGGQIVTYWGVRAVFLFGLGAVSLWFVLFVTSFVFGQRVLHQTPPQPLFVMHRRRQSHKAA